MTVRPSGIVIPTDSDALILVDVQVDFLPGGALGVPDGNRIVPIANRYLDLFHRNDCMMVATRDAHPAGHCSFQEQGGPWPPHCITGTPGFSFASELQLPAECQILSKGITLQRDAYSGFEGTGLTEILNSNGIRRVWISGLATDYCVLATVQDARQYGFEVVLLTDAIKAVNVRPGDGEKAITAMIESGAVPVHWYGDQVVVDVQERRFSAGHYSA